MHKTIKYALEHKGARLGVFRDTLTALKITSLLELREALDNYEIPYRENKTEHTIEFPNGSIIFFRGLDDLKKVRSLNLDFIWVEQAEEIKWKTFAEVEKRLRGKVSKKYYGQLILTVTPEEKTHWIYNYFHRLHKGLILHFHYKTNIFLPKEYVDEYEDLKDIDYELYVKYTLGKWGKLTNIVYENWDEKELPQGVSPNYWGAGADFGYNDPCVFLLIAVYDNELYIVDEIYQRHLTNPEFIDKCNTLLLDNGLTPQSLHSMYGDAAEPDRIEEFKQKGYNAFGGSKNVLDRIENTKRFKIHLSPKCVMTKKEIQSYKFMKDKDGNVLDKPVKFNDHAMNSLEHFADGITAPKEDLNVGFGIII